MSRAVRGGASNFVGLVLIFLAVCSCLASLGQSRAILKNIEACVCASSETP
jgi:hypothetical protein